MDARSKTWLTIVCVTTVAAGSWLFNPFSFYFLNDDFIHIPLSKDGVLFQRKSFRPVCDLSIALDYWLWNKQAWGYHFMNLLLHVINTVFVYVLASQLLKRYTEEKSNWVGVLSGVLFFTYPFHSESIYWIIGRSGSLGTLFFIPAVIFYFKRNDKPLQFFLSALFFAIGLITYEAVWIYPFIAVCISWLDRTKGMSSFRKEMRHIIIIIMIFILFLITRYAIIGEIVGTYEAVAFKNLQFKELLVNGAKLVVRCFAPPGQSIPVFITISAVVFAVIIVSGILFYRQWRSGRIFIFFLVVCFGISLLPYLSLGIDTHGVEGERFLYLPSVFVCIMIVYAATQTTTKVKMQLVLIAVIFSYSIFFLAKSQNNYVTAGKIARVTIDEINKLEGKQKLYVDSLPQEYNGALIFRLGFDEAVKWMKDSAAVKEVLVNSKKIDNNWTRDFETSYAPYTQINGDPGKWFNPGKDAWFLFTNNRVEVRK